MEEKNVKKSYTGYIIIAVAIVLAAIIIPIAWQLGGKLADKEGELKPNNNVVENTTNSGEEDNTNSDITKLTDAEANEVRSKATIKVSEDLGDLVIYGYILDNVFYFDIDDSESTSLYKLNNVNNPVRVRIFNKIGALGMAPTYYVITEDGKVFAVPNYIGADTEIERVFEEYKVKDINKINVECDDTCHGEVILVLQDDTVKEIKY